MTTFNLLPMPMWIFVDEDGNPASGGTLESFRADNQSQHLALYEDRAGNIPLPNPISLSKAGAMTDAAGNVVPIAYGTDDQNYFLQIKDQFDTLIATIDDFNANAAFEPSPVEEGDLVKNYILNSQFRFFELESLDSEDKVFPQNIEVPIADEGWTFLRDNESANITIEFKEFPAGQSDVPHTPTYYLYINKSGGSNEAKSDIRFKLGRIQDFANQQVIFKLHGISGTSSAVLLLIENNYGTGGSTTTTEQRGLLSFTNTWASASTQFQMPDIGGKAIGTQGDDLVTLILRLPLNESVELGLVNGQYNFGTTEQPYEFKNYFLDLMERNAYLFPPPPMAENQYSILISDGEKYIFENYTGSIIYSSLYDAYPGYLPADGVTVVRTDKVGSSKVTYDRLYQAWENDSHLQNGNAYGYGEDGFFPMTYTNNMVMVNEKEETKITAWADSGGGTATGFTFEEIRTGGDYKFDCEFISETAIKGRDLAVKLHSEDFDQILTVINVANGNVTDATSGNLNAYAPVIQIFKHRDGDGGTPEIQSLKFLHTAAIGSSPAATRYFTIFSPTTDYKVYFVVDDHGQDPGGITTNLKVNITAGESKTSILLKVKEVLENTDDFIVIYQIGLQVQNKLPGSSHSPADKGTSDFYLENAFFGQLEGFSQVNIFPLPALHINAGTYFDIANTTTSYRVWFKIDGVGTAPTPDSKTLLLVELKSTDDTVTVLWRIAQCLKGKACNKIICSAASGLAGKAFLFENDSGVGFYNYYIVDGSGIDPEIPNRIPVKTELVDSDTSTQVAEATAKTISSYYFKIPNYNGYFLRPLDESGEVDTGVTLRLPRDDGNARALLGTLQPDANRAHSPGLIGADWGGTNCDGLYGSDTIAGRNVGSSDYYRLTFASNSNAHKIPFIETTGFEGRPKNITVKCFIKF